MNYLWVVEMKFDGSDKWGPTVGVALTKSEASEVKANWQQRNKFDKFRLRKYVEAV